MNKESTAGTSRGNSHQEHQFVKGNMAKKAKSVITVASAAALLMVAYHMVSSQVLLVGSNKNLMVHLGTALAVVYLFSMQEAKTKMVWIRSAVFLFLSMIIITYLFLNELDLLERRYSNPLFEQVMGLVLILLVLEASRESFGLVLPLVTVLFTLYPIVGSYLPEPFSTTLMEPSYLIGFMALALDSGIWSRILPISISSIYLFVVFAGLLQGTGAVSFFMQLGRLVASRIRGGPGLMSVVASSAVGMITGSAGANIALTGSFTIPLMKQVGYKPHQAGAIEAAASSAGVITPPVMGATAFLMAGLTGIPYLQICAMAIIPALTYYIGAGTYVYLRGAQLQLGVTGEKLDIREFILSSPNFLVPLLLIIFLLLMGMSIMYTAFWAIISVLVLTLIRKKTRPSLGQFISGFAEGCRNGAGIACMCAATGLIFDMFTMSGTTLKLSAGIEHWSGGSLLVALFIVWIIGIIMGMIGVGLVAYLLVSLFAVKMLMTMGLSLEASHYFILYTTAFGFITPPVAVAAIIASKLAGSKYIPTAIEATKVGIGGFLVPWLFIFTPMMLLAPGSFGGGGIIGVIVGFLIMVIFQIGFVGYLFTNCCWLERGTAIVSAGLMFVSTVQQSHLLLGIGLALITVLVLRQWRSRMSGKATGLSSAVTG